MDSKNTQVGFRLRRLKDERWRDCAIRHARNEGLVWEVCEIFDALVREGMEPGEAALQSLMEWDCCPLMEPANG